MFAPKTTPRPRISAKLAEQAIAGFSRGADEPVREPADLVSILVYVLGFVWFVVGPCVYLLEWLAP